MENQENLKKLEKIYEKKRSKSTSALKSIQVNRLNEHQKTLREQRRSLRTIQNDGRERKDRYRIVSKNSLLKNFKNTTMNGFNQVRQHLNSFSSMILKPSKSKSNLENYNQITNVPTPVKLYSPFSIETPPANVEKERLKLRQQLFTSPSNKIKKDLIDLSKDIERLNMMTDRIPERYRNNKIQGNSNSSENEIQISRNIFPLHISSSTDNLL
ncbi:hypothetical protein SSS_02583 [Sarcoptes scabiei]|uniref:Uncharacterized protein n=1 Tax=Sarcoptes scabiei TaxID=52283 RepID=A0A834RH75_SARSC|nr:hypothetical protein SSS_02583 [Sarcoptes scabiei]